jgi:hypothetical protein
LKKLQGDSIDVSTEKEMRYCVLGSLEGISFKIDELKLIKKSLDETRIKYEMNRLEPRDDLMLNF